MAAQADGATVLHGWRLSDEVTIDHLVIATTGIFPVLVAPEASEEAATTARQMARCLAMMTADLMATHGLPLRPLVAVDDLAEPTEVAEVTVLPSRRLTRSIFDRPDAVGEEMRDEVARTIKDRLLPPAAM